MNSTEFEQQVARIIQVLEGDGARVQWNAHIPDPDNPQQLRQIDVTVRRADSLSILECRHHARPQDVTWVEELYGRKASLGADCTFGVSASGFTHGAQRKARRLGIFLRELQELTDSEVLTWGRKTNVRLCYIHLRHIDIFLVPTHSVHIATPNPLVLLRKNDGTPWPIGGLFRHVASQINQRDIPEGVARIEYFPNDLYIGSIPVPEIIVQVDWRWVQRDVHLPFVLAYRNPENPQEEHELLIEKIHYTRTEVYHTETGVAPVIDVSLEPLEPQSYLVRAYIDLGQSLPIRGFGAIGDHEPESSLFRFRVLAIRRDSLEYARLFLDGTLLEET